MDITEKVATALANVADELRGIKGAINTGIQSQSLNHEVLVNIARLEERMEQTNRSLGNLQKTLLGLAVSVILGLITAAMKGLMGG